MRHRALERSLLMWRAATCALSLVLMTANVQGQTRKNAAFLVEQCRPLASLKGEPSDPYTLSKLDWGDIAKINYCVGF